MFQKLAERRTLWISFIATVLITLSFPVAASIWGLSFVDPISDPALVRQAIADMSAEQRLVHVWVTATLDVAYPLAYGALFVGAAVAFYPRVGRYLAMIILVVVPTDLLEGVVQVLALTDTADWVGAKAVLTPLKTILFLFGFLVTIAGWASWFSAWVRQQAAKKAE